MGKTWTRTNSQTVLVGLTQEAIDSLGDILTIVPRKGSVEIGKSFLCVESTRKLTNFKCPVEGQVVLYNDEVLERPNLISATDWLIQVVPPKASA